MEGTKNKKFIEWIKTTLIVLLTASALLLGWQTKVFNDFFSVIPLFGNVAELVRGAAGAGSSEPGGVSFMEATRPLVIVITDEHGERYGAKYDTDERNSVYYRTSSILGDALGSASSPLEISENEWRIALSGLGVYFEYLLPVRLSILDGWLGASLPDAMGDASVRRVFVAFDEEMSRVYYQDFDSGLFFVAETASSAGKAQELEIYSTNGALFAFETGVNAAENAPYVLIMPGSDYSDVLVFSAGSADVLLDLVLDAMGHSNDIYSSYYPNNGMLGRVGTQFNIRVDTFERVFYRQTDNSPSDSEEQLSGDNEMIERARAIVADTIGKIDSDAEIFYESMVYGENGSRSLFFGYYIAGGRIYLYEDGYAARITFTDGIVTEVELNFRCFSQNGEYTSLLPERLALASAGGEFILCYYDTGAELLQQMWVHHN